MPKKRCNLTDAFELDIFEEDRATAYHEAGHAIMHVLCGIPFKTAEIFNDKHRSKGRDKAYAGIVRANFLYEWPAWALPWLQEFQANRAVQHFNALACILLAGELAESIHRGRPVPRRVGRFDRADLRRIESLSGMPMRLFVEDLRPAVQEVLRMRAVWEAVRTVAEALLARAVLSQAEVLALAARTRGPGANVAQFRAAARRQCKRLAPGISRLVRV